MRVPFRSILITLVILAAAVAALAWWRLRPLGVDVVHATRGDAVEAVYGTGIVEPTVQVPIAPRVAARLV